MKNTFLLLVVCLCVNGCWAQKSSAEANASLQIDYVDLYVTTPLSIKLQSFYSYFGKSVKTVLIKDEATILKTIEIVEQFCKNAEKVKLLPDTRLVITIYYKNKKQIITMGTTLLNINSENYIANDLIRAYFGELTNNQW
jgi:hypothetical protein